MATRLYLYLPAVALIFVGDGWQKSYARQNLPKFSNKMAYNLTAMKSKNKLSNLNIMPSEQVKLTCDVPNRIYKPNDYLEMHFSVTNASEAPVYLITPLLDDTTFLTSVPDREAAPHKKKLEVKFKPFQIYDEHFSMPDNIRLEPGTSYTNSVRFRLAQYSQGDEIDIYFSAYFLEKEKMEVIDNLLTIFPVSRIGADFRGYEIALVSAPISIVMK